MLILLSQTIFTKFFTICLNVLNQNQKKISNIMNIQKINESKVPIIVFDKKLEQFRDKLLFPEKLERAKEIIAKYGLPATKKK